MKKKKFPHIALLLLINVHVMGGWQMLEAWQCSRPTFSCSTFMRLRWAIYEQPHLLYHSHSLRARRVKTVSKAIISIRKLLAVVVLPPPHHHRTSSHSEKPRNPEMGTCSQLLWFSVCSSCCSSVWQGVRNMCVFDPVAGRNRGGVVHPSFCFDSFAPFFALLLAC